MNNDVNIQPDIRDKIISAAYKDSSLAERISIWFLIRKNPEFKKLYNEYRKTAHSVRKIKLEKCPPGIVENAVEAVKLETEKSGKTASLLLFRNPAAAGALAILLLAVAVVTFTVNKKKEEVKYSKAEVQVAEQQVKSSLAMIGRLFNKTTKKLEEDIIPLKVNKPIKRGFEIINQLFPKGVKTDENS